jgi:hypothetical protein
MGAKRSEKISRSLNRVNRREVTKGTKSDLVCGRGDCTARMSAKWTVNNGPIIEGAENFFEEEELL